MSDELIEGLVRSVDRKIIYHYTNIKALKSILETKAFHLSHISCLNDYTEFEDGVRYFYNRLSSVESNKKHEKLIKDLEEATVSAKKLNFCIFSSCLEGDLLNQWRVYGDDGYGLAIGLDTEVTKCICNEKELYFGKCLYSEESKEEIYQNILLKLKEFNDHKKIVTFSHIYIGISSLFFKNKGFNEEQEARIATYPLKTLDIKERDNREIPFYLLDIKDKIANLIKEVVIGPSSKSSEMAKAAEILLEKAGINKCMIKESSISYRSLGRR